MYHAAPAPALPATSALLLVLAALATLIAVAKIAIGLGAPLHVALAAAQLGMLALTLLVLRAARLPPRALGIAPAQARYLAAAVLIGASIWYLNLALIDLLFDVAPEEVEALQRIVERPPLGAVLLAIALVPAVCEEVLFRGALLRALAARIAPAAALGIAAAMFAVYHFKPVQMLPTFTLGIVLGALSLRAGSILPSVIAHGLNNTMAIVVHRQESESLTRGLHDRPDLALAVCGALFLLGVGIAITAPIAQVRTEGGAP
ncbi:MAG TPA: CPBP family intramembrane glutamic endopeptidase [Kofleriaceae bacterium]|nr:CPBP family intramembrane glutamic endopeptidase [Kofleriaceae bacterium]